MAKTIFEIAEELDVSKQAIRYQMKKINKKYLSKRHDGAILISAAGEMIIRENMGRESNTGSKTSGKKESKDQHIRYEKLLDILEKELDRKDEDIKNLNDRLKEQQRLLDQQQQLNLHHLSNLQLENSHDNQTSEVNTHTANDDKIVEVNETEKKGLLKTLRIFFNK